MLNYKFCFDFLKRDTKQDTNLCMCCNTQLQQKTKKKNFNLNAIHKKQLSTHYIIILFWGQIKIGLKNF